MFSQFLSLHITSGCRHHVTAAGGAVVHQTTRQNTHSNDRRFHATVIWLTWFVPLLGAPRLTAYREARIYSCDI
jgi:hypothetical protein